MAQSLLRCSLLRSVAGRGSHYHVVWTFNHGVQGSNPCGLTTLDTQINTFKDLGSELANLSPRLANVCSPLFSPEGLARELRLIGRLRTRGDLLSFAIAFAERGAQTSARFS